MPTIYIDNQAVHASEDGQNLLQACLSLGFDIPYFCWHPAMHSVGACRQCAVKQFKNAEDKQGPDRHGLHDARRRRDAHLDRRPGSRAPSASCVTELLMANHPHDCPVCDEGGECHLQDMTVMTGHTYRRYRFQKRTHRNQDLGPFVNHEMNRCIACYRCVRFYRDYAGGRDFDVFGAHDYVYFGRDTRRRAGKRVQRQPGRGLPDRRLHRQDAQASTTRASGTCRPRPRSASIAGSAATPFRASATACCAASATASTARSTAISCATAGDTATSS